MPQEWAELVRFGPNLTWRRPSRCGFVIPSTLFLATRGSGTISGTFWGTGTHHSALSLGGVWMRAVSTSVVRPKLGRIGTRFGLYHLSRPRPVEASTTVRNEALATIGPALAKLGAIHAEYLAPDARRIWARVYAPTSAELARLRPIRNHFDGGGPP